MFCFLKFLFFKGFNLQMPDTKLQPTNTMKSENKSIVSKDSAL